MSMVMAIQTSNPLALVEEPRLHALQNSQSCSISIPSTDDRRAGTGKQRCDNCARNAPTRMQNFGGPLARFASILVTDGKTEIWRNSWIRANRKGLRWLVTRR